MGASMNMSTACTELVSRLEQLSAGAKKARHRLNCVDQIREGEDGRMLESFTVMAVGMTGALGDIVERLARLDKILRTLEGESASGESTPCEPATMAPLPRRSPPRRMTGKPRTRRKSRTRSTDLRR